MSNIVKNYSRVFVIYFSKNIFRHMPNDRIVFHLASQNTIQLFPGFLKCATLIPKAVISLGPVKNFIPLLCSKL